MSSLERCPLFRVSFIERVHALYSCMTFVFVFSCSCHQNGCPAGVAGSDSVPFEGTVSLLKWKSRLVATTTVSLNYKVGSVECVHYIVLPGSPRL